jgi:ribosomal protein L7/L12
VTITDGFIYACLFSIALITLFSIDASMKRLERKIKRIELSLSLILNRMEIEVPSQHQLSDRVKQVALDPYRKIEAIKLYRAETQSGLREAKEAIEEFLERNQQK